MLERKNMNRDGLFIVLEGIDGSGTTTQADLLEKRITQETQETAYKTKEPSENPVGKMIRKVLTGKKVVSDESIVYLFAGDRVDHCKEEIEPKLNNENIVISDRYLLSSLTYQSNSDYSMEYIYDINSKAITPDITIFLDVSVDTVMDRMSGRETKEMFEKKEILADVKQKYHNAYDLVKSNRPVMKKVDAEKNPQSVLDSYYPIIEKYIE